MESSPLRKLVPTDAATLGMVRVAVCGFTFCEILATSFSNLGRLPVTLLRPTGAMKMLPWRFYDQLLTPSGMVSFKCLLLLSLGAAALGFFTSWATKLAALLFIVYQGILRSFGHFNHDEMPAVYILVVLALAPCGDAFSLDNWRGRIRLGWSERVYGYPILLMRVLLAWSYFSSALIKLRVAGLGYLGRDNLPALAIEHSLDNLHDTQYKLALTITTQVAEYSPIFVGLVLVWELLFPLAIFLRRARLIILVTGLIFHLATMFLMNIFFPYHIAMYVVFVDWGRLATKFRKLRDRHRAQDRKMVQGIHA